MSTSFLIDEDNYQFLSRLGIKKRNLGVYDGDKWSGNGQVDDCV